MEIQDDHIVVACANCRKKCEWVSIYEGNDNDHFKCDKCLQINLYGPRFRCKCTPTNYNTCYRCTLLAQTHTLCGCLKPLKPTTSPSTTLCSYCNTYSKKGKGNVCTNGCAFTLCSQCSKINNEKTFLNAYKFSKPEVSLGKGAYGEVFKGKMKNSNPCAIKKINLEKMSLTQKCRTLIEIEIHKKMNHPIVISLYDYAYSIDDKYLYIAMALIEGEDLSKVIKKQMGLKKYFSEKYVVKLMYDICLGVQFLHHERIIHRDLKPQNIMITKEEKVLLADFGMAYDMNAHFQHLAETVVGTPLYISPEILRKAKYDTKTDVWSLGVILHELLRLDYTFAKNAESLTDVFKNIQNGCYDPLPPVFSKKIGNLVQSMLTCLLYTSPSPRDS